MGVSSLTVGMSNGSIVQLIDTTDSFSDGEILNINRQATAQAGITFGVGVGAHVECGAVHDEVGANAGVGGNVGIVTEDHYSFPENYNNSSENIIKYILLADGNNGLLDATLTRLLILLENNYDQNALENTYIGDLKGIQVGAGANASAEIGAGVSKNVGLGANANIGSESKVNFDLFHNKKNNTNKYSLSLTRDKSVGANAIIKIDNSSNYSVALSNQLNLNNFNGTQGMRFSILKDKTTGDVKEFELSFINKNSKNEETIIYQITGQDVFNRLFKKITTIAALGNISENNNKIILSNATFSNIINQVFTTVFCEQKNNKLGSIHYEKKLSNVNNVNSFNLGIGIDATKEISADFGAGVSQTESSSRIVEEGYWINGKKFALETYGNKIPVIGLSYNSLLQNIINSVPLKLRKKIGMINLLIKSSLLLKSSTNSKFYIGNTGSYLRLSSSTLPDNVDSIYCTSWSWYGDAPSVKSSELSSSKLKNVKLIKASAEK